MKEIVERILKEERMAQDRIEKARKESEGSIQNARTQSQELLARSSDEAAAFVQQKKKESQQEFIRQKEDMLAKTRAEVEKSNVVLSKDIPAISQKIFKKIISIQD
jgi:vacuolar-type H+-ATPase subunit H